MSEGWSETELDLVQSGLLLLGWRFDSRLTADECLAVEAIAEKARNLDAQAALTPKARDDLSFEAFGSLSFQLMNVDERARMATGPFSRSSRTSPMLPIIEEATLCYYRGYYTASLGALFLTVEHILRDLHGWTPGQKTPTFAQLRRAPSRLAHSDYANDAQAIVDVIYSHYMADDPPPFYFNRHGLLHGLRGRVAHDRLNAVRMFGLLDVLVLAEGQTRGIEIDDAFHARHRIYSSCVTLGVESQLLHSG